MAADTVDIEDGARTEKGAGRSGGLGQGGSAGKAVFFSAGGLIHAAVGLGGGTGGFLTERPGFSRKAWSRVAWRAA